MSVAQRIGFAAHTGRAELRCATPTQGGERTRRSPGRQHQVPVRHRHQGPGVGPDRCPHLPGCTGQVDVHPLPGWHTERAAVTGVVQRQHRGIHRGGLETRATARRAWSRGHRGSARGSRDVRPTRVHRSGSLLAAGLCAAAPGPAGRPGHLGTASARRPLSTTAARTTARSSDVAGMPLGRRPVSAGSGPSAPHFTPGQDSRSAKISAHSIRHSPQMAPRSPGHRHPRPARGRPGRCSPAGTCHRSCTAPAHPRPARRAAAPAPPRQKRGGEAPAAASTSLASALHAGQMYTPGPAISGPASCSGRPQNVHAADRRTTRRGLHRREPPADSTIWCTRWWLSPRAGASSLASRRADAAGRTARWNSARATSAS